MASLRLGASNALLGFQVLYVSPGLAFNRNTAVQDISTSRSEPRKWSLAVNWVFDSWKEVKREQSRGREDGNVGSNDFDRDGPQPIITDRVRNGTVVGDGVLGWSGTSEHWCFSNRKLGNSWQRFLCRNQSPVSLMCTREGSVILL